MSPDCKLDIKLAKFCWFPDELKAWLPKLNSLSAVPSSNPASPASASAVPNSKSAKLFC